MAILKIIDLWAPWCAPCRKLGPILEHVVTTANSTHEGAVELLQINVDEDEAAADTYDVKSVPTVLYVKDNQIVARIIGLQPSHTYSDLITEHL
jgi:thioredoxin